MAKRDISTSSRPALARALGFIVTSMLLGLACFAAGCTSSLNSTQGPTASVDNANPALAGNDGKPRVVKIALLLPTGGFSATAAVSKSMRQAGEMALFERNDPSIQLIVKDDKGTAEGAATAATLAISEGAQIILGPLLSKAVAGAAPVARSASVPVISFSNNEKIAGNGVYLMSFLPHQEVERITNFALQQGKRRFAALIPDTVYGHTIEQTFRSLVARAGGQVIALERYTPKANGMLEPAKRVMDIVKESQQLGAPIEALFLPGGPETLPNLGPLIAYSGLDPTKVQLLGTNGWDYPNIGRDQAFVGGWYPSPDPRGWKAFSSRFSQNFGQAPPRLASLAYDAVNMAITLAKGRNAGRFSAAAISQPTGFQGVDGPYRFTPNGLSKRGLAILQVKKFGSQMIDAAPATLSGSSFTTAPRTTPAPRTVKTAPAPYGAYLLGQQ